MIGDYVDVKTIDGFRHLEDEGSEDLVQHLEDDAPVDQPVDDGQMSGLNLNILKCNVF